MRSLLFLTLFVSGGMSATAQVSLGFKGGANLNQVNYTGYPEGFMNGWKPNIGYHVGVFGQIKVAKAFSVIYELQFIQRGAHNSLTKNRININYLELPVLIAYSPMKLFQLELGYSTSARLSTRSIVNGKSKHFPLFDQNFEAGITTGIRFHLTDKFSAMARYYHGLNYVDKIVFNTSSTGQLAPPEEYKAYNSNIQLSVAYKPIIF